MNMEQPGYALDWNKISSAFQWITELSHSSSSREWQTESISYLSRNIAFYAHIFLMQNECFSIVLVGPSHPPEVLGVHKRFWTRPFPADTPFASCHSVTYAGTRAHQSWFVSHPSLSGRGRDSSDRLALNCFHSLGWHRFLGWFIQQLGGSWFLMQCGLKWFCLHLEVSIHPSTHSESLCWALKVLLAGGFAMRLLYPVHTRFLNYWIRIS